MPVVGPAVGARFGSSVVRRIYSGSTIIEPGRANRFVNPSCENGAAITNVRTNLIQDPTFSSTALYPVTAGSVSIDTDGRLKAVATGNSAVRLGVTHLVTPQAAGTFTLSVDLEATSATLTGARIYLFDTGTSAIQATGTIAGFAPNTGNKRYAVTMTFASGTFNRVYIEFTGAAIVTGDTGWMDNAQLEVASAATPFFYGGSPAVGPLTFIWGGAANASLSRAQMPSPVTTRTNSSLNPNAVGAAGFSSNNSTFWTITKNQPISGHPQGIISAARSAFTAGHAATNQIASIYNIDTLSNTSAARWLGCWLYCSLPNMKAYWFSDGAAKAVAIPQAQWFWLAATTIQAANSYSSVTVQTVDSSNITDESAYCLATGVMADTVAPCKDAVWGDRPSAGDFIYGWTGATNNSTSIERAPTAASISGGGAAAIQASDWFQRGSKSIRIISQWSATGSAYADLLAGTSGGFLVGHTYTVTIVVRTTAAATAPPGNRMLAYLAYNSVPSNILTQKATISDGIGVATYSITFTVPAAMASQYLRVYNGQIAGGPDLWFDCILVEEIGAPDPGGYKDGSFAGWSWDGTAHASVSRGIH